MDFSFWRLAPTVDCACGMLQQPRTLWWVRSPLSRDIMKPTVYCRFCVQSTIQQYQYVCNANTVHAFTCLFSVFFGLAQTRRTLSLSIAHTPYHPSLLNVCQLSCTISFHSPFSSPSLSLWYLSFHMSKKGSVCHFGEVCFAHCEISGSVEDSLENYYKSSALL